MPSINPKYVDGRLERLSEENQELRKEIDSLRQSLSDLKTEVQGLQFVVSENIERREMAETNLATLNSACSSIDTKVSIVDTHCKDLTREQDRLSTAVELQAQYSRLTTLLLSGDAIPRYHPNENTLSGVLTTIREYLGISIHPVAISACHRLRNRNVILIRFLSYAERDAVYRRRIRPLKPGLFVHESLTAERLAVVKLLRSLHHPKEHSPFQSHYTSQGKIYVKPRGSQRAVEVGVGATRDDILALCGSGGHGGGSGRRGVGVTPGGCGGSGPSGPQERPPSVGDPGPGGPAPHVPVRPTLGVGSAGGSGEVSGRRSAGSVVSGGGDGAGGMVHPAEGALVAGEDQRAGATPGVDVSVSEPAPAPSLDPALDSSPASLGGGGPESVTASAAVAPAEVAPVEATPHVGGLEGSPAVLARMGGGEDRPVRGVAPVDSASRAPVDGGGSSGTPLGEPGFLSGGTSLLAQGTFRASPCRVRESGSPTSDDTSVRSRRGRPIRPPASRLN